MQKYQWAIKITLEWMDGNGGVEDTTVETRECSSEKEAHTRHETLKAALADHDRRRPKYQRVGGSELLRRPVGDWETVEKA